MGKKAKKKADRTSDGEAPLPPPGEGATLAEPVEAPGPAEGAVGPALSTAPLPLDSLAAAELGAFFELTFPDKRLLALCHELGLHTPGYRLEALPPDQVARVLADEFLAAKDVRPHLEGAVRQELVSPALEDRDLLGPELSSLIDLVIAGDPLQHLARI